MTVDQFFQFCKDRSQNREHSSKNFAVLTSWGYLYAEHPSTVEEVECFLDSQIRKQEREQRPLLVEAYTWLREVLVSNEVKAHE